MNEEELTQKMIALNKQLIRSNRDLEQFAYAASHDLQAPLRAIVQFISLLREEYFDVDERPRIDEVADVYMSHITRGAERMQSLIEGLLMFSRIDQQTSDWKMESMADIVRDAMLNLRSEISETNAKISIESLPKIMCSRHTMVILMQNLIHNAMRFRKDSVDPNIRIWSEQTLCHKKILVSDNGIGFDQSFEPRIYGMFQRLNSRIEGTGMGLAICRKIVEHHHGKIGANSEEGKGATFWFSIPTAE